MGRIRTQLIKRMTRYVMNDMEATKDYAENKAMINDKVFIPSKKIRNAIAGYATKLKKSEKY